MKPCQQILTTRFFDEFFDEFFQLLFVQILAAPPLTIWLPFVSPNHLGWRRSLIWLPHIPQVLSKGWVSKIIKYFLCPCLMRKITFLPTENIIIKFRKVHSAKVHIFKTPLG